MSIFKVNLVACNPEHRKLTTMPLEALVDTGSELTWLPAQALRRISVKACGKRPFKTANGQTVEREVGYAVLRANDCETAGEVVFAEAGDTVLLGARALEGFGVAMDDPAHHFVSIATLAAFNAKQLPQSLAQAV